MLIRYLEMFFRHKGPLTGLLVVAIATGSVMALAQPRTYQASSRLWFEKSTVGDSSGLNAYLTPADQAAGVFRELLDTRAFCVGVGHRGPLADYLGQPGHLAGSDPISSVYRKARSLLGGMAAPDKSVTIDDTIQDLLQRKVTVTSTGPEVVTITFDYRDAVVAGGTLQALLDQFSEDVLNLRRAQAQNQVRFYQEQSKQLQESITSADAAVGAYLAVHPEQRVATPPPDANLASLQSLDKLAHDRYASLVQQLDQAQLQLAGNAAPGAAGFRVLDKPETPHLATSLTRTVLVYGGGTAAVGILLVTLVLVFLVLSDNTIQMAADLDRIGNVKVVGTIPKLRRLRS